MHKTKTKIFFVLLFSLLVFIGSQINFSELVGAQNQFFTLFQFFGPVAGGFLGPLVGVASVLLAEIINFAIMGKEASLLNLARFLPMLFAAYYFGTAKKKDWGMMVPVLAIAAFVVHPVGQQVWFFALYWTIPLLVRLFNPNNLFFKSLGATFTAHAVGGALWIYTVPTTPALWVGLIPIVAIERVLFALGIAGSYIVLNTVLQKVEHLLPKGIVQLNSHYNLSKRLVLKA